MELEITPLQNAECYLMSGSAHELGSNAGQITWNNCLAFARSNPLITDDNRQEIRDHFAAYGAWDRDEINAWDDVDLAAMVWQEGASSMREFEEQANGDWEAYYQLAEKGTISGRLSHDDKGGVFIYIGC